jgi:hypothetical protein
MNDLNLKGRYVVEHLDINGNLKGQYEIPNGIVDEGLNHILDVTFNGSSQVATWYIGLVDSSGWTAFADADVLSSHAGWSEFTNYTEGTRVAWTEGAATGRAMTNAVTCDFSIITSNNVKSTGNTGTLWSTAAFSTVVATANGDTLKVTYTISG